MSTDRGTMHRGQVPGTDGSWPEPTAPAGRRLPSAPRERKPALAALAVLLILGGALGAGFLVIQSGKRVAAIEISQQIGAGQKIPQAAMQEVQIASGTGLSYVPWAQASQVANFYATNSIPPGTLLTSAMVVATSTVIGGRDVLGLALKDGQLPDGLQDGDRIDIYAVSDSQEGCPGTPGTTLAANAIVLAITSPPTSSSAVSDVRVALNPNDAGAVACNASNGFVGIAVLPNGGKGAAAQPAPPSPARSQSAATPSQSATPPGGQASSSSSPGTRTG